MSDNSFNIIITIQIYQLYMFLLVRKISLCILGNMINKADLIVNTNKIRINTM